jgi:hypothetical protein
MSSEYEDFFKTGIFTDEDIAYILNDEIKKEISTNPKAICFYCFFPLIMYILSLITKFFIDREKLEISISGGVGTKMLSSKYFTTDVDILVSNFPGKTLEDKSINEFTDIFDKVVVNILSENQLLIVERFLKFLNKRAYHLGSISSHFSLLDSTLNKKIYKMIFNVSFSSMQSLIEITIFDENSKEDFEKKIRDLNKKVNEISKGDKLSRETINKKGVLKFLDKEQKITQLLLLHDDLEKNELEYVTFNHIQDRAKEHFKQFLKEKFGKQIKVLQNDFPEVYNKAVKLKKDGRRKSRRKSRTNKRKSRDGRRKRSIRKNVSIKKRKSNRK